MITGFSHAQLVVGDVEASGRWYEQVLGMERFVSGTFDGGAYLGLRSRSGRFVIGLQTGNGAGQSAMIEHLSFAVAGRDDLEAHRAAAAEAGLDVGDVFEEAVSWNVRLRDPDGLVVELTAAKPTPR